MHEGDPSARILMDQREGRTRNHGGIQAEADGPVPFHYPAGDYATALTGVVG